jgi:hypothetical protein
MSREAPSCCLYFTLSVLAQLMLLVTSQIVGIRFPTVEESFYGCNQTLLSSDYWRLSGRNVKQLANR